MSFLQGLVGAQVFVAYEIVKVTSQFVKSFAEPQHVKPSDLLVAELMPAFLPYCLPECVGGKLPQCGSFQLCPVSNALQCIVSILTGASYFILCLPIDQ